jgi:phage terminase large subunit
MPNTLIDFRGDHGTPYAVYEAELDRAGKAKILREIFKPHSAQIEFFASTERHVLFHGNRGSGKSAAVLWKAIQTAYLVPGSRVAIFRKTWPELKRSVWDEMLKLPADLYHDLNASDHTVTVKARDRDGSVKDSKIWFVTAQNVEDARKVLSFEVHTLLIDEWAECELEIWRFMAGSVRSPLYLDVAGRPAPAQILGASTPGGAGAEALRCLFGCDGAKKPAPTEEAGSYRPEQYRAIRASIDQNPTYAVGTPAGDAYRASLMDLPPALQAKWIRGEWGAVEGCYFIIWNARQMVIPFAEIRAQWWDSHFLSIDYGFGKSSAAAHLHVCLQDQSVVTIAEIVEQHMAAYDFAREIVRRFDLLGAMYQRRNVVVVYQDPANKSHIGTGHSVRDQINEVLAECDLGAIDGSNDRIGGWQLMYQMLARGQWHIADTCPLLSAAIPSRVHDPKRPGDLLKVGGDPLDDAMDSARYGLYSWVTASEKPKETVLKETVGPLMESRDYTSALIRFRQITDQSESRPASIGRQRGLRR